MKYEQMKKEDLVKMCYEQTAIKLQLIKENDSLKEHRKINEELLFENMRLKEEYKQLERINELNQNANFSLREQLEIYKECLQAISSIKGE